MVPVFARTTVVPFEDVVNVAQTTSFGIQVVSMGLDTTKHTKGITIAMGLEVDLLFQLLHEVRKNLFRRFADSLMLTSNGAKLTHMRAVDLFNAPTRDQGKHHRLATSSAAGN